MSSCRKGILVVLLLLPLLLIQQVTALGVVPSSQEITFEAGKTSKHQLKILNNEGRAGQILLYVEGELSQYLTLSDSVLEFDEGQTEKLITITFAQPQDYSFQGKHQSKIVARQIPRSGAQIAAALSVNSLFTLVVPYEGSYADMRLFVGELQPGVQGNFVVEINNLGTKDIASAQVFIDIIDAKTGQKVETLLSNEERVLQKTKKHITVSWIPDVPAGVYTVKATVVYDGKSIEDQKVFSIGSKTISIEYISVQNFKLGGIAKFDTMLKNQWNDAIKGVYGQIEITQGDNLYASSTTQTVDLSALGNQLVVAYWDTDKVVPGAYDLSISLFYNGKVQQESFPIVVTQDSINTGFTGQVIGLSSTQKPAEEKTLNAIYILIILVIIVLIVNVILLKRYWGKKKNPPIVRPSAPFD